VALLWLSLDVVPVVLATRLAIMVDGIPDSLGLVCRVVVAPLDLPRRLQPFAFDS
jgi:hypothetical protein